MAKVANGLVVLQANALTALVDRDDMVNFQAALLGYSGLEALNEYPGELLIDIGDAVVGLELRQDNVDHWSVVVLTQVAFPVLTSQ